MSSRRPGSRTTGHSWLAFSLLLVNLLLCSAAYVPQKSAWVGGTRAVMVVAAASAPSCSVVLISGGFLLLQNQVKLLIEMECSVAAFEVPEGTLDYNSTQKILDRALKEARRVRRLFRCVVVVVLSESFTFLDTFAKLSLKHRLLAESTKLIFLTRLPSYRVEHLLSSYWTFSMMNAVVLNQEESIPVRITAHVHLPYSQEGPVVKNIGSWGMDTGLSLYSSFPLFPDKFNDFHGARVNVTALPYTPHWVEEVQQGEDGSNRTTYSGTDYFLLSSIAHTLNFKINVLPTTSWDDVVRKVEERKSFMATVFHNVLPQRLERYDYSYTYEYGSLDFSVAKPSIKPNWQSLYRPLSNNVWLAILAVLIVAPISFYLNLRETAGLEIGEVFQMVIATFLAQSLTKKLPHYVSSRSLAATWLVFALLVGTVYRGNLTAYLTLPNYPPRTETLQQLVDTFNSITMPPFGTEFIMFFMQSNSTLYKGLAEKMSIVPDVITGLQRAQDNREAHVAGKRYMEQMIAKYFTRPDGSTQLYVGQESLLPGIAAWPVPHDAPYRCELDRLMMAVVEGGLYEKWSKDMLQETKREARIRQKKQQQMKNPNIGSNHARPLTTEHLQGVIVLLLVCLAAALIIFTTEIIVHSKDGK